MRAGAHSHLPGAQAPLATPTPLPPAGGSEPLPSQSSVVAEGQLSSEEQKDDAFLTNRPASSGIRTSARRDAAIQVSGDDPAGVTRQVSVQHPTLAFSEVGRFLRSLPSPQEIL